MYTINLVVLNQRLLATSDYHPTDTHTILRGGGVLCNPIKIIPRVPENEEGYGH